LVILSFSCCGTVKDGDILVRTDRIKLGRALANHPRVILADEPTGSLDTLTAREMEVLQLLAFGHTNKDIAERLGISAETVKAHLEHIFEKLEVSDRAAAVATAFRRGLIE
jgi:DNA-binding NarL/FixJ family response regulator